MLLTNHFELAASTIAAICKEQWQIKLFFELLKWSGLVASTECSGVEERWTRLCDEPGR